MRQVYSSEDLKPGTATRIEGEDYVHLSVSLRMRPGEGLLLVDPAGLRFEGVIKALDRQAVTVEVEKSLDPQPELRPLALGLCMPAGEAFDSSLEAAVQLGATEIIPLISERSQRLARDKTARWARIAREACCQSFRAALPQVQGIKDLGGFLSAPRQGSRMLAAAGGAELGPGLALSGPVSLVIGPEGGFSPAELESAAQAGWKIISLGPRILRVPVAVAAALASVQLLREGQLP